MPGPAPKHPSTRARRNKTPGARTLAPVDPKTITVPDLPPIREWHPRTIAKWEAVHLSPMFPEYDESDIEGLIALAILWDTYWRAVDEGHSRTIKDFAAEIRMNEQRYGLSPIDRRRLAWEIDRGEQAEAQIQQRRNRSAVRSADEADKADEPDPREMLG